MLFFAIPYFLIVFLALGVIGGIQAGITYLADNAVFLAITFLLAAGMSLLFIIPLVKTFATLNSATYGLDNTPMLPEGIAAVGDIVALVHMVAAVTCVVKITSPMIKSGNYAEPYLFAVGTLILAAFALLGEVSIRLYKKLVPRQKGAPLILLTALCLGALDILSFVLI